MYRDHSLGTSFLLHFNNSRKKHQWNDNFMRPHSFNCCSTPITWISLISSSLFFCFFLECHLKYVGKDNRIKQEVMYTLSQGGQVSPQHCTTATVADRTCKSENLVAHEVSLLRFRSQWGVSTKIWPQITWMLMHCGAAMEVWTLTHAQPEDSFEG